MTAEVRVALEAAGRLKVLHPDLAATLEAGRFQRKIRFAARLQHPTSTVVDSGEAVGRLWFTMPFRWT